MASPALSYRLSSVVDLDTSEYECEREKALKKLSELTERKEFEQYMLKALEEAAVHGQGDIIVQKIDKRTDVQRKADEYFEEQNARLGKLKERKK